MYAHVVVDMLIKRIISDMVHVYSPCLYIHLYIVLQSGAVSFRNVLVFSSWDQSDTLLIILLSGWPPATCLVCQFCSWLTYSCSSCAHPFCAACSLAVVIDMMSTTTSFRIQSSLDSEKMWAWSVLCWWTIVTCCFSFCCQGWTTFVGRLSLACGSVVISGISLCVQAAMVCLGGRRHFLAHQVHSGCVNVHRKLHTKALFRLLSSCRPSFSANKKWTALATSFQSSGLFGWRWSRHQKYH